MSRAMYDNRRIGKVKISEELILGGDAELMAQLMMLLLPLRVERMYNGVFEYIAICNEFDQIPAFEEPPEYLVTYHGNEKKFTFERVPR